MHRFRNILVVFDDEEQTGPVFERAVDLSEKNQARLKVVDVLEEPPRKVYDRLRGPVPEELTANMVAERTSRLEAFVSPARRRGVEVDVTVLQGVAFLEIIREVIRDEHDLVMKSVDPLFGWRQMLFSSTDMHLMRKCPGAVWIMKSGLAAQHNRILAAVDPSPESENDNELDVKIMDLATSLADSQQSELNVVNTWTLYGESMLRSPRFKMSESDVKALADQVRAEHKARLDTLLQRYDLAKIDSHIYLLKGDAGRVIPEFARDHQIELIVMGTTARSRVAGLMIGDTAENILRQVDCSVLTVKPEEFVSPIELDA